MTPQKEAQLREAARNRQFDLVVVLENVHDPHNISAVLRTCESIGIQELYLLVSDPGMQMKKIQMGKRSSAGTRKWMQVYRYHDVGRCFEKIRQKCRKVYGTFLGKGVSQSHLDIDFIQSCAIVFGNEHTGLTSDTVQNCDEHFLIPQMGLARSLNISVACAVTLYEAFRQRNERGLYNRDINDPLTEEAMQFFKDRIASGENGRNVIECFD